METVSSGDYVNEIENEVDVTISENEEVVVSVSGNDIESATDSAVVESIDNNTGTTETVTEVDLTETNLLLSEIKEKENYILDCIIFILVFLIVIIVYQFCKVVYKFFDWFF